MKKHIILFFTMVLLSAGSFAQVSQTSGIPLIGDAAPSFTANSTKGLLNFPGDYGGKWKILFSHPADFTPVCTSEILELSQMQDEFEKLGVKLFVISTEPVETHNDWVKSMETLRYKQLEAKKINFPLIADENRVVSRQYGMIHANTNSTKNVRGVFIIDPKNKVRSVNFYPMEIGRNMDEIKRAVIAMQKADKDMVYTPANWNPGDDVIIPYQKTVADAGKITDDPNAETYKVSWYMFLKKSK